MCISSTLYPSPHNMSTYKHTGQEYTEVEGEGTHLSSNSGITACPLQKAADKNEVKTNTQMQAHTLTYVAAYRHNTTTPTPTYIRICTHTHTYTHTCVNSCTNPHTIHTLYYCSCIHVHVHTHTCIDTAPFHTMAYEYPVCVHACV